MNHLLRWTFMAGIVMFFGFLVAISLGIPAGQPTRLAYDYDQILQSDLLQALPRNPGGVDLDKWAQIIRDQQNHDERLTQQQISHEEKTDAERLSELKVAQEQLQQALMQLQQAQAKKDSQDRLKKIGAIVYSAICGLPALVIVVLTFLGRTAIPPKTANWAYATLGAIGSFWIAA